MLKKQEIEEEISNVLNSGALGRSKRYIRLLRYLAERTITDVPTKEIDIAIDVFDKRGTFDPSTESYVRVYVHNLRKKLEDYYSRKSGNTQDLELSIPVGSYKLEFAPSNRTEETPSLRGQTLPRQIAFKQLAMFFAASAAIFFIGVFIKEKFSSTSQPVNTAANSIWAPIYDNDRPIIIAQGDFFFFEEEQDNNRSLYIRDTAINSLEEFYDAEESGLIETGKYTPSSNARTSNGASIGTFLVSSMPDFPRERTTVKMASELTTADIRENHIIFIGHIKTLGLLSDFYFDISNFSASHDFTRLTNTQTKNEFLLQGNRSQRHTDYGLFARMSSPAKNKIYICTGMTDTAVIQTVKTVISNEFSTSILNSPLNETESLPANFESLLEVAGYNRDNITSKLLFSGQLDPSKLWDSNSATVSQ